jgi:iron complex transport system substrate-binding protein
MFQAGRESGDRFLACMNSRFEGERTMLRSRGRLALLFFLAATAMAAPARIVSTAPSITDVLYALGLGDRVVGDTTFCRYPPEARTKPKVGTYLDPNLEVIASLRPDLVIIQNNPIHLARRLETLNLRVLEVNYETPAAVYVAIRQIGMAAGVPDHAAELVARLQHEIGAVRAKTKGLPRRRVMFIIGRTPDTLGGLVAVGSAPYLNELMEAAGGVNVFRDARAAYPNVTLEEVLARNPEVIVDMGDMAATGAATESHKHAVVALWGRYPALAAVREHRVFAVASDIFVVPGPRIAEVARAFAHMLHPEAGF